MVNDHAVVITGGGPAAGMRAGELAWAGIDVAIVESGSFRAVDRNCAHRGTGPADELAWAGVTRSVGHRCTRQMVWFGPAATTML